MIGFPPASSQVKTQSIVPRINERRKQLKKLRNSSGMLSTEKLLKKPFSACALTTSLYLAIPMILFFPAFVASFGADCTHEFDTYLSIQYITCIIHTSFIFYIRAKFNKISEHLSEGKKEENVMNAKGDGFDFTTFAAKAARRTRVHKERKDMMHYKEICEGDPWTRFYYFALCDLWMLMYWVFHASSSFWSLATYYWSMDESQTCRDNSSSVIFATQVFAILMLCYNVSSVLFYYVRIYLMKIEETSYTKAIINRLRMIRNQNPNKGITKIKVTPIFADNVQPNEKIQDLELRKSSNDFNHDYCDKPMNEIKGEELHKSFHEVPTKRKTIFYEQIDEVTHDDTVLERQQSSKKASDNFLTSFQQPCLTHLQEDVSSNTRDSTEYEKIKESQGSKPSEAGP